MKAAGAVAVLLGLWVGPAAWAGELMAMPRADFARRPELGARVSVESLDQDLLAAAIFHETNRVRQEAGLPALSWLDKLNGAAEIQARVGGEFRPPSHTNPFTDIGNPLARVRFAGLKPHYVTENIALVPIYELGSNAQLGIIRRGGKATYVDVASGQELRAHTYAGFAALVVHDWMNSPGHRKNLLDPAVQYLGCGVVARPGDYGEGLIFSVQVFYTPERKEQRVEPEPDPGPRVLLPGLLSRY